MAKRHSIPPFPEDIDREGFGYWLSGFTDGEGSFNLIVDRHKARLICRAGFSISLRADDLDILRLIQKFWQCGGIYQDLKQPIGHPAMRFKVGKFHPLRHIVLPHFEKYPLLAKKRRDFEIWKQGVILWEQVASRRSLVRGTSQTGNYKWTTADHDHFITLADLLKSQRKFKSLELATPPNPHEDSFLFPNFK